MEPKQLIELRTEFTQLHRNIKTIEDELGLLLFDHAERFHEPASPEEIEANGTLLEKSK